MSGESKRVCVSLDDDHISRSKNIANNLGLNNRIGDAIRYSIRLTSALSDLVVSGEKLFIKKGEIMVPLWIHDLGKE